MIIRSLVLLAALALGAFVTACAADQVSGALTASGDGSPRLYMLSGSVTISGSGSLLVSHNAKITCGTPLTAKPGRLAGVDADTYNDFTGTAVVTGTRFTVGMYGTGIKVNATGAGFAILFGTGTYAMTTNATPPATTNGKWTLAPWDKGGNPHLDISTVRIPIGQLAEYTATGAFTASGDGSPRCYMTTGSVQLTGTGTLMVSHNAQVTFPGAAPACKPGKLAGQDADVYDGITGTVTVSGTNFVAGMYGKGLTVSATGAGYAMLFGTGTYTATANTAPPQTATGNWAAGNTKPAKIPIGQANDVFNIILYH